LARHDAWSEAPLDRLIDAVEHHAPDCRVVVCDSHEGGLATQRWPELARFAAVVGPLNSLLAARNQLEPALMRLTNRRGELVMSDMPSDREKLASNVFSAWHVFKKID